jgi:hypothetical protein
MEVLLDLQEKQRDEEAKGRRNIISFLKVFTCTKLDSKILSFDNVRKMDIVIGQLPSGKDEYFRLPWEDFVNRLNLLRSYCLSSEVKTAQV